MTNSNDASQDSINMFTALLENQAKGKLNKELDAYFKENRPLSFRGTFKDVKVEHLVERHTNIDFNRLSFAQLLHAYRDYIYDQYKQKDIDAGIQEFISAASRFNTESQQTTIDDQQQVIQELYNTLQQTEVKTGEYHQQIAPVLEKAERALGIRVDEDDYIDAF